MSSVRYILKSIASGYVVVAIQAIIGIIMVPYLISEKNLGLEQYGTLMLIQSSVAILSILLDGLRLETARIIGKMTTTRVFVLNEINLAAFLLSFTVGGIYLLIVSRMKLENFGVHITEETFKASIIFVACFIIEQLYYSIDSYFHAIKQSIIANILSITDTFTRALLVFSMFEFIGAEITHYAQAIFICLGIKFLIARTILRRQNYKQNRVSFKSLSEVIKALRNAPTQTLQGLSPYMIFRGAVILSGLRLGTEQAAVVAIFIQTIRNYFNQALFSGLRPFILPFLSATQHDQSQRTGINKFFLIYQSIIFFIGSFAAITADYWFPLWLGDNIGKYAHLTWIVLIGYTAEVALLFHYYDLIASGKSQALAYLTFAGALLALLAMYFIPQSYVTINVYLWIVTIYILYWSLLVTCIKIYKGQS